MAPFVQASVLSTNDYSSWLDDNKDRLFFTPARYVDTPSHYKTDVRRRNHGGTKETLK
jgi:hypothetical protein